MKFLYRFLVLSIVLLSVSTVTGQNKTDKKEQAKHQSKFESKTLANNQLPVLMPYNRLIDPAGDQVYFGDNVLENHALDCAVSPDGKWIAVEGRYSIVLISAENNKIVERATLNDLLGISAMNTFSGISWHKTGENYELYWSASGYGSSYVLKASWNNRNIKLLKTFLFMAEAPSRSALPNELAVSEENGKSVLYVVLNGNNKLVKLDAESGEIIWSVPTGVAPYGVIKTAGKIYVTNWAGAVPDENDKDTAGVPWGKAKVSPKNGSTREGTVSVFDPENGNLLKDIEVGLHPNDIITSADQQFVFVANANSDAVSVINTKTDAVVENIPVRLMGEEKNPYFGDSPNGLGISNDGKTLYVAAGMDNAVAVVELGEKASGNSQNSKS